MTKIAHFFPIFFLVVVICFLALNHSNFKHYQQNDLVYQFKKNEKIKITNISAEPLLRGKVNNYDQEQQLLYLQTDEQLLSFPLSLTTTIYCWPTTQNGVQISEAYLPLGPGQVIHIEGESKTTLDQLNLAQLAAKYVFLQQDQNHQLVKVALISCYE